ncbi:MAG: aminopeptidase N [Gammaproteobacteria bacterium]|nr:aminopeptidase N [Gammaproteobacteria bacterium]
MELDTHSPHPREPESRLTEIYARFRSELVSDIAYTLFFDLDGHSRQFLGKTMIRFELKHLVDDLSVDFSDGVVEKLRVNGRDIDANYNGSFIALDKEFLRNGPNSIIVWYRQPYSSDGAGLHRFTDPEDGRVYVYSHFEPYDANRAFPCFDQPDLKASYTLEVKAPANWHIISATPENEIEELADGKLWRFPESQKFSTYILPLHGGQFRVWENRSGKIPLRLYSRYSMARHVEVDDWFRFTQIGLDFFAAYFAMPFPYDKYDQLIVPEFNIGGMENVAAVTYNERYLKRGEYTAEDRETLADVLLHELSHMWLGDLVTPDWWNGLWLKESFATYMASLALAKGTEFENAWHTFFSGSKQRAYEADQWVTTHPVEVPVDDTRDAFAHFDAITYQKGASVLTQFAHYVGEDKFRDGIRLYLQRHAGQATTLEDFINAVSEVSGKDLTGWVNDWLKAAGLNTIQVQTESRGGTIRSLEIHQSAPVDYPVLREHRIQLGLYRIDPQRNEIEARSIAVTIAGQTSLIKSLEGESAPDLIFPNLEDWGYVKVRLDAESLRTLAAALRNFQDPFLKSMLWQTLWDMALDAVLPLSEYADLIRSHLPGEQDRRIVRQVTATAISTLNIMFRLRPQSEAALAHYGNYLESLAWQQINANESGSDLQKLWLDTYACLAHTTRGLTQLRELLDERVHRKVIVDQDRRWQIVSRLNEFDFEDAEEIAETESSNDGSDAGQRMFIATLAARPDMEMKLEWLDEIQHRKSPLPLARKRAAMQRLFPAHQQSFHKDLAEEILKSLKGVSDFGSDSFLSSYAQLIPVFGDPGCSELLEKYIRLSEGMHPILAKRLRVARQDNERLITIGKLLDQTVGAQKK